MPVAPAPAAADSAGALSPLLLVGDDGISVPGRRWRHLRGLLRWESRRGRHVLRLIRVWNGGSRGVLVTVRERGRKKRLPSQTCAHASCAIKIMTADAGEGTPKLTIRPILENRRAPKQISNIPRAPSPVLTSADKAPRLPRPPAHTKSHRYGHTIAAAASRTPTRRNTTTILRSVFARASEDQLVRRPFLSRNAYTLGHRPRGVWRGG